ncbi:MAG: pyruvate:ferredoxin (flavodoxin) oxidoreductase [Candidatus Omnitrophica bacterium]|nr:pyruvate:ferredoxin (flavodoxin) oxidoreductase [Candidatus Omnitrophota bacterium]MDE2008892.1 pyruvate:ferredoxin (flavodoxin) oxidoreductase [Candidatus Omnitrophota bacterium]MDE2213545.1 pyruvate:ferredoxin (flavodoxin) oxidoreductase [Candidatus Omnitrophota bacterium]MDE2230554.1 pyruvate:ferredoxin (flavodoxin) oxidoreductase [Candidatus Omnitrophota bacterium]
MAQRKQVTIDGNEAAAYVAFAVNEVIAIYPITPSSPMGEWADEWNSASKKNIWGTTPLVQEMQSEAGVAGAVHGALQTGALTTTFTCSQGLLLMLPNMYKIAGELSSTVFHIAARSLATQGLSIFGDHQDVMAARMTGFAMLCSASVQEVMDMALISQAATLEARIPFVHFFDGFRTSHEVAKIEQLSMDDIRAMIDEDLVLAHRRRRLTPDAPVIRGTAQNPDVHFQSRETVNPFYQACPGIVQKAMDTFAQLTGRQYKLFQYYGETDAKRVVVIMGSGAETCQDTVDHLLGQKVGVLKVRLYRPFAKEAFVEALPKSVTSIAVLDRTKEPGSSEPLYLDVVNALVECGASRFERLPKVIGGRYGISSKEFTPAMVKGVFDELLKAQPKNHFTVGINDDLSHTSLDYDQNFNIESQAGVRAIFYGLGADGTVSANKNSIKIIGENTPLFAQGYFVYDSKKSGSMTVSHLRFGPKPIHSTYLINKANFVACHQSQFLETMDVLQGIQEEGIFLLNSHHGPEAVWQHIPRLTAQMIRDKKLRFFVIDAYSVAGKSGMGGRINTIMQTCFFAISGVLPKDEAIAAIKESIKKAYGKKGEEILKKNYEAVDNTLANLHEVKAPSQVTSTVELNHKIPDEAPEFVRKVTYEMIKGRGEAVPVSALPCDGTYPVGTTKWEKRNIAQEIPVWDNAICIQCGKCAMVCPHAVIRIKAYDNKYLRESPSTFKSMEAKDREWSGMKYTIQVAPEDCTGCGICVDVCPVKNKSETKFKALNMKPQEPLREEERKNWEFFLNIPDVDRNLVKKSAIRSAQTLQPLFEFSGACAGCGETPYIKLATQLFGDRMVIANATGCSSIYGGNLPTTPYTKNNEGRGPAWSNSLFEDNAEFGLGFRISIDKQKEMACEYVKKLETLLGASLVEEIIHARQTDEAEIFQQRGRVQVLKEKLRNNPSADAKILLSVADMLVKKSVWIIGGDGWAYDIGYGGLDHVISSGRNVNILVLDTEVYSNTGGQASKSTSRSAVAKFAAAGKSLPKKDLARMAMTYGYVYVASVSMGAKDEHTLKTFLEAEAYDGPSLIIAYSHCIAHGINMTTAMQDQKAAVSTGYWPLFRYNPGLIREGKNPLTLDSAAPKGFLQEFLNMENRFKMLSKTDPEGAKKLAALAQQDVNERWRIYSAMASDAPAP